MESFRKHNDVQSLQWQHCYLRTAILNLKLVLNGACKVGNYLHKRLFYFGYMWKWLMIFLPRIHCHDFYSSLLRLRAGTTDVLLLLLEKGWQICGALFW